MIDYKCPKCGNDNWNPHGHYTYKGAYRKGWRCSECEKVIHEDKDDIKKEKVILKKNKESGEVIFLDKKVKEDVNWRDWLANMKEHQQLSKKGDNFQDEATIRITPNKKGKAGVCISADWHLGSLFTDYDELQKNLELILDTPFIYQITVGDLNHNFRKFNKSVLCSLAQVASPNEQGTLLSLILKEMVAKNKWLCATWGNHDVTMDEQLYGQSVIADLLGEHFPYFNGKGRLNLLVGEQKYIIEMSHFYPGHSIPVSYTHLTLPTILLV